MTNKKIEGELSGAGLRFGVVVSRVNEFITSRLLAGTLDALTRSGVRLDDVEIVRVPGAFEIPITAKKMAQMRRYDAIICLGALIRGETPHFDYLSAAVTQGITQVALESGIPLSFGVLTTNSLEQAIERAGAKQGNKGWEAAIGAIEMANLFRHLK
ncbi:MAG TPA: 6,7-dimethyl-8-ribityllumazine synthase [Nitrospiria bacterium]|nr:6,7-dimethyl-8-ribityllumazine synthase [Nitrospiria bacterium]